MLLDELWIDHLANAAHVEPQTSHSLWQALCTQLETRLSAGLCINLSPSIGYWLVSTEREYVARLRDGVSYIIPPRLVLSITTRTTASAQPVLNLLDLEPAISESTGVRPDATRAWLEAIEPRFRANLQAGREVVWAGLGSFAPIIEGELVGYTFTPAASFAATINRPFAMFAPVELQNEAVSGHLRVVQGESLADFVAIKPIEVRYDEEITPDEPEETPPSATTESAMPLEPTIEEGEIQPDAEEGTPEVSEEPAQPLVEVQEREAEVEQASDEEPQEAEPSVPTEQEQEPKRRGARPWLVVLRILPIVLLLWVWYRQWTQESASPNQQEQAAPIAKPAVEEGAITPDTTAILVAEAQEAAEPTATDTLKAIATTPKPQESKAEPAPQTPAQSDTPEPNRAEIVTIKPGNSLMQLALRKYGNKVFWVYIYEENREKLSNPDNIPLGVELSLPPARKYGIDASNTNSLARALDLQRALLGSNHK